MITLLVGENSFEVQREVARIRATADVEMYDGAAVTRDSLPGLLMGATLFSPQRTVIIGELSEHADMWAMLGEWLPRVSDDVQLVLIETKPDKRTKTYKALQKDATIKEFPAWTDKDRTQAETWLVHEAQNRSISLDRQAARTLVARVGVDQWSLHHALEQLAVFDTITPEIIERTIEASPQENVFQLFETALRGDRARVHAMLQTLEQTEDPFMLFGLLSSQVFQLAAAGYGDNENIAKDFKIHPFVLSKLQSSASRIGRAGVRRVVHVFAETDAQMKRSAADPWLLIEKALLQLA